MTHTDIVEAAVKKKGKMTLQCMECLPPKPLNGHPSLHGVLVHSRIDCPPDTLYMINEEKFNHKPSEAVKGK